MTAPIRIDLTEDQLKTMTTPTAPTPRWGSCWPPPTLVAPRGISRSALRKFICARVDDKLEALDTEANDLAHLLENV